MPTVVTNGEEYILTGDVCAMVPLGASQPHPLTSDSSARQDASGVPSAERDTDELREATSNVVSNISTELNKRLEQLEQSLNARLLGPGSPTGHVMVTYNKARVQFQSDCRKVVGSFKADIIDAKAKYEKAVQSGKVPSDAPMQKISERYTRKVTTLQGTLQEVVMKGNSVLDTEQLSISLLKYWAEHDSVVRQVYNSFIDLDQSTRGSCVLDMSAEMKQICVYRDLLATRSQGLYNIAGDFVGPGGECGLPANRLSVPDLDHLLPPPQPLKVPISM
jgi:flagellar hook-basal body complex protein FliE